MQFIKKLKRPLSLCLAVILFLSSVSFSALAESSDMKVAQIIPRNPIFRGKALTVFGKTHNSMSFYQVKSEESNVVPTFCLEAGKKLWDGTSCAYEMYEAKPGQSVPYIGPFERYLPMVLAYEWLLWEGPYPDSTRYGIVQVYYWGCIAGYEDNWDAQEQAMHKFAAVMGNPAVMTYYQSMKDFIVQGVSDFNDSGNSSLPDWNGSQQKMTLKDGYYELVLDISTCPELKDTTWNLPDTNWSYQISADGNSITFFYNGTESPQGTIVSGDIPGIESKYYAYIFNPPAGLQTQMGRMDLAANPANVLIEINPDQPGVPEIPQLELYRHSETFETNYNIDLEKYCAETNQPLEGTTFNVWEDFDFSQVNESGYTEGSPDGSTGEVYLNCMSPEPQSDYICDTITTDTNGHAAHGDIRNYNYSKTYCMGHPAPEWIECDHDGDGEEAEECDCEEENERLREQWLAEQELCAATCDFHVQNDNEDNHEQDTAAMEAMLVDRDETYERFINLEYSYHLEEKTARTGYILHGLHSDDPEIETVILTSAQAGGGMRSGEGRAHTFVRKVMDPVYTTVPHMAVDKTYTYPLPEAQELSIEEQRSVVSETKKIYKEEEPLIEESEVGNGDAETGETGGGDAETGETGGGNTETGETGSGDAETGGTGGGDAETGETGGGNTETGETGSGDAETGETGSGDTETGEAGSGDAETGGTGDEAIQDSGIPTASAAIRSIHPRFLLSSPATGNEAESPKKDIALEEDEPTKEETEDIEETVEEYEYIRNPLQPSIDINISYQEIEKPDTDKKESLLSKITGFIALLSGDDEDSGDGSISASLPSFIDDTLDPKDVSAYGDPATILYTFKVWDHRTEGRIHINKRDLELFKADQGNSYGQTQGDTTLEGAVYGLFAAQDILHPDGKSGVVYNQNDVVAIATTDKNGDASFLAYTEKPGTRLNSDGNVQPPNGVTGPESLYNGSSITSSDAGFGTISYPDYMAANGDPWIGRPLIMGNYYIMELSRSEGYELSVNGAALAESNRTQPGSATVHQAGQAQITGGLSDYNNMSADGSWNDFMVETYKTQDGYDIVITGYPAQSKFYRVDVESRAETEKIITGSSLEPKRDAHGNPVYQTAKGGEYKIGPDGNPIIRTDTATGSSPEGRVPCGETLPYRFRTAPYPSGAAAPKDMSKWNKDIDSVYLKAQVNNMLGQIRYKDVSDASPWAEVKLTGTTNSQAATEILDWFTLHNFFDCGYIESIYKKGGAYYARVRYDYSAGSDAYPAVYDSITQTVYVRKSAQVEGGPSSQVNYWMEYPKGGYSLSSKTVSLKEKQQITGKIPYGEEIENRIQTVYQPSFETYQAGEILLDRLGNPIPVMERVITYTEQEVTHKYETLSPVDAAYNPQTGVYTIHVENTTDWTGTTEAVTTTYRAVTPRKTIEYQGQELPYNEYLTDIAGAGVSVLASIPAFDPGSYIKTQALVYPGQTRPTQDGGTGAKPVQVLQRAIKQSIKITKDISQESYDNVNTYGSIHNDPLTVLLGLFNGGSSSGTGTAKILNQFKFKLYLKSNLENIFVDDAGTILSEDIGTEGFPEEVQKIYLPPKDGGGRRLLETKEDGIYNYRKFLDAMEAANHKRGGKYPPEILKQFAITYYDIDAYKKEILAALPALNSDVAYDRSLERAQEEAAAYLDIFVGLDARLSIAWDKDPGGGADGDKTTLQCNTKNGKDDYYNNSIMLPYGTYIIAEQTPSDIGKELANRHFDKDYPKELTLPFAPEISTDENTGETEVHYQTGSAYYRYDSGDSPEDLIRKYDIRFNEETHIIKAHGQDGDFEVYKYGLDKEARPGHSLTAAPPYEPQYMNGTNEKVKAYYTGYTSQSEDAGTRDGVVYDSHETASGQMEVRDHVPTMVGMQTAVHGKFASMLVPWTILAPAVDRVNPDTGSVETLVPSGSGPDFNFVAFAQEDFEDMYYRSKLRIEKLDAETGETIIHDGALFKIYAAKRDVKKSGVNTAVGTGKVLFGEAMDWEGNPVTDTDGAPILYPRVGQDNESRDDLPIRLDKEGIPQYEESQLIKQEDGEGNETGIFKAYSTVREVVIDGQVKQVPVGYIETYKPLGAGAYVLVEIQAPKGYTKSRPVAFEVYADDVTYYTDLRKMDGTTEGWAAETAAQYQYAVPVSGDTNKFQTETVSQIKVRDYPSRVEIHKVEDGDSMVGNENGLQKTDAQGQTEQSGGFDGKITVNDAGDQLIYKVHGRKEKLEERGDVRDIAYDAEAKEWYGYVTKSFDAYSEKIVEGTEKQLKATPNVKLLYTLDGTFTGKGIDFTIPISGARLSLYQAVELEKTGDHTYKGVTVSWEEGKVTKITDTHTGTHKEIQKTGQDSGLAGLDVWDTAEAANAPVNLYFYDLEETDTREEPETGELAVLDGRGNKICYADSQTGMAYVYDDYGRMLAYIVDGEGNKELVKSIQVMDDGTGQTIYEGKTAVDDENGLPIYYTGGTVSTKDETWITDASTDPHGTPETTGAAHAITRLPFGAYILQEEETPYEQGYIQAEYLGLVVKDTEEVQKYFLQNQFTKAAFAKLDVRTQKEIEGATMTLYRAALDKEGNPILGEDEVYEKGEVYASWISGYLYDDNGNLKLDTDGNPIPIKEPHWIDHIPVGPYVLEETVCPYEQGYVQSECVNVDVRETGHVQSFEMEDDFTSLDIRKYDTKNQDVIYEDSETYLSLYRAKLDETGHPIVTDGIPQYDEIGKIFTFRAATYKDGQEVAATGRVTPDAGGERPIVKYDYEYHDIPGTYQGRYYYTEEGSTRLEYLPVGAYVLVESGNPEGYATADPVLIQIEDKGHLTEIQKGEMGDRPLRLEVSKVNITGGKEVNGAKLAIYPVDESGAVSETPLVLHQPTTQGNYQEITAEWISGLDGRYTEEEEAAGLIPDGFVAGDLKPHLIEYIPEGDYILREETTPYGFLQSVDIPFTIIDTKMVQKTEMIDEIPEGVLKLTKSDTDRPDQKLPGVQFQLTNQTLNQICETVTTDDRGEASFSPQPIGYMDRDGNFKGYTYVCKEIKAGEGHMLTLKPYEFQFEYKDDKIPEITLEYNPTNDSNRVITEKLLGDTEELLEGVTLRLERKTGPSTWEWIDEWVTGKQPHETKDLKAGEYRLSEIKMAEGFKLLAAPMEFTITDGMTAIPHLQMRNYAAIVDVEKTEGTSGRLLAGARLQLIRKDTGKVIREWTSEEEMGQRFYGLEAGTYVIHEVEAPSGYQKAEDREVTVTEDKGQIQAFRFENQLTPSSGGGNTPKPVVEYISFKKIDTKGNAVEGAEFTFYDSLGRVIGISKSNHEGTFRIRKPEDGTYTFRETKAPSGYAVNPDIFSFTVTDGDVIRGDYEIEDRELEVHVTKLDGKTNHPLPGAKLEMKLSEGEMEQSYEGITGEDGTITFHVPRPGTYVLREVEAPDGYMLTSADYMITVEADGRVKGELTIYNWKERLPVVGKITAVYKVKNRFGKGTYRFGTGIRNIVKTGDQIPMAQLIFFNLICAAGFIISTRRRKHKSKINHLGSCFLILLIALVNSNCVYANDINNEVNNNGSETLYVSGELTYTSMEPMEPVPQEAWISIKDAITGKEAKVLLPLTDYRFINETWIEDFDLEAEISNYGADYYLLGGQLVESQGEFLQSNDAKEPLTHYAQGLLSQAGLDKESYQIDKIWWKGNAYERDGVKYRDMCASGRKLVRDCKATYSGEVNRSVFSDRAGNVMNGNLQTGRLETEGEASSKNFKDTTVPLLQKNSILQKIGTLRAVCIMIIMACSISFLLYLCRRRHRRGPSSRKNESLFGMMKFSATSTFFAAGMTISSIFLLKWSVDYHIASADYKALYQAVCIPDNPSSGVQDIQMSALISSASPSNAANAPEPEPSPAVNESLLREMNSDYRFWLSVPGTKIEYPVVQHDDNEFYLTRNFNREERVSGSIFLDCKDVPLVCDNTIVYGHNMKDGTMFADLKRYLKKEFFTENPYVKIYYKGQWVYCPIFSCQLRHKNDSGAYKSDMLESEWDRYLEDMLEASLYKTGVVPGRGDKILTLSTCYGTSRRLIIQALLKEL